MLMIDVSLIEKFEGFSSTPYICPAGKATIGIGSTFYEDGTPVKMTDKPITKERARELVRWYCENKIKYPRNDLNDDQKASVCSLIYNIGQGAFDRSKCKKAIVEGNWAEAHRQWDWITANGKVLPGLVLRRQAEKELFFKGLL